MSLLLKSMCRNALRLNTLNRSGITQRSLCSGLTEIRSRSPGDPVLSRLKSAHHAGEVLAAVQTHLPEMTQVHLLQALRTLFQLHKAGDMIHGTDSIIKDPTFDLLCQNMKKYARELEPNEAIEAIKVLSILKVPTTSLIIQTLLQILRCNINELNIKQIMFLDYILGKFDENNHLVDALRLALPLAFQIRLPLELDNDDLPFLKSMLSYCSTRDLPDRCINNVVTGLLLHDQAIDARTAKSIIWSLCQVNCTQERFPTRVQLLHICCDILSMKIDELTYDEVLKTTAMIKGRILEKHPEYYHENLMDSVADYVVRNDVEFEKGLLIARVLSRIAHTHLGLVEYLCQLAVSTPTTLSNARTNVLFGFVNCLSNNNFKPEPKQWEEIRNQISKNPILDAQNSALPWAKLCLELASLGHYEDKLLKRVFSKEFLDHYLDRDKNNLDYIQLLMLYEAVKSFHSDKYSLPETVAEKAKSMYPSSAMNERVEEFMARGLGGSEYVCKNVMLPSGIVVDLLTCIKGGYPLKLPDIGSKNNVPIEKLNLPQDAVIICVLNFNQGCFSMNSNRLRGTFKLLLDVLEKQGYMPVPINVTEWASAPGHERTPYLMREIGYKCGEVGMKLSVT